MAYLIDELETCRKEIDGRWVAAKPLKGSLWWRIKDAWMVLKGKCVAVGFYKQ